MALGLREWPQAQGNPKSSRLETGNNGDGLCRPSTVGFGCEDLHPQPVIRELAAAIEANRICSRSSRCCSAATQSAADRNGETTPFVPTTEDQVEQTHLVLFDGSHPPSRQPRFGRRGGYFPFRSMSR